MTSIRVGRGIVVAGVLALAAGASAQVIVTAQNRQITGASTSTDAGGPFSISVIPESAPEGDFGMWNGTLFVPGFVSGMQSQVGGFNGVDTFELNSFSMNLGGGNGPGTSADSVTANTFGFTFTVDSEVAFELDASIGCAGPSMVPDTIVDFSIELSLVGPSGDIVRLQTLPENGFFISASDVVGVLAPGSYTLTVVGTGHVAFVAPPDGQGNGAGGGAGGPQPSMVLRLTPPVNPCRADFNGDGLVFPDDLSEFITCFFLEVQFPGFCPRADFNGDGLAFPDDLSEFITTFFLAVQFGC